MKASFFWLALSTVFWTSAAFADARGDVMEAARRCAAFADTRTWLDCYYGAAQPVRSELGLPPAPASQTRLVPMPAAIASPLPSYAEPAPDRTPSRRAVEAPKKQGWWSRFWGSGNPDGEWQALTSYTFDRKGLFTVRLADGTSWRQSPSDPARAHLTLPAGSYQAILLSATSGAMTMRIGGGVGLFTVEANTRSAHAN